MRITISKEQTNPTPARSGTRRGHATRREPLAGVVGALQFDVIVGRLRTEYGVEVEVDPAGYAAARWIADADRSAVAAAGGSATRAVDREERLVLLFASEWELQYFQRQHPAITLLTESPVGAGRSRS